MPPDWDRPLHAPIKFKLPILPFGVRRIHLTVADGQFACIETQETGTLLASWRPGVPGKPGDWQDKPPAFLEGDVMLVVTAVKPGAEFALEVTEVSGEAECEEDEETTPTTLGDCGGCPPSQYYHQTTEATSEG